MIHIILGKMKNIFRRNEMRDLPENTTDMTIEPEYYTDDGRVICQYRLKPFKTITKNHLAFHDMTLEDYKNKYREISEK